MTQFSGSCLCGAVTYRADCVIKRIINCHCDDCRKTTGAVHATLVLVPEEGVRITGHTASFTHPADSGAAMTKRFCPSCGTQLFLTNSRGPGTLVIQAGTIAQKDLVAPQRNIFCDSAIPSTPIDADLPKFPGMAD